MMKGFVRVVSESFIWSVGITRPKPGKEHAAALYITCMLLGSFLTVGVVFLALTRLF